MSRKGGIHTPNSAFEQIAAAISALPLGTEFSVRKVRAAVPKNLHKSVSAFMTLKCRSGWLERTARGVYRVGGVKINTTLPSGIIAEAVWAVLFTEQSGRHLRLAEVAGEAEVFIGRPGASVYRQTSHILSTWHRDGHLERIGKCREYAYRVKEGVTERPVCTR